MQGGSHPCGDVSSLVRFFSSPVMVVSSDRAPSRDHSGPDDAGGHYHEATGYYHEATNHEHATPY